MAPHALYGAFALGTLFFLSKVIQTSDLRFLRGALVCLGLAFLTVEYAPLLVIVLLVTMFVEKSRLFANWSRADLLRFTLRTIALPLLLIGVLWPAGLYKLSLVKNYGFFFYYAMIRNREYGSEPILNVWLTRIGSSPLEYLFLISLSSFLLHAMVKRHRLLYLLPFVLYAALVFLTTLRNRSGSAYYVSSLIPCLGVLSAFAISLIAEKAKPRIRGTIAAIILAQLAFNNFWFYYRVEVKRPPDERLIAILNILRKGGIGEQRLLVPSNYVPTIHYYFHKTDPKGYAEADSVEAIARTLDNGNFDGIIYEGSDSKALQRLLEKRWSFRDISQSESEKPGRSVSYFRLLPIGWAYN